MGCHKSWLAALCLVFASFGCRGALAPHHPAAPRAQKTPAAAGPSASVSPSHPKASTALLRPPPSREEDADLDETLSDDTEEHSEVEEEARVPLAHPLDEVSAAELRRLVVEDLASLGSLSLGRPSSGRLMNGVQPEPSSLLELVDPAHAFGTTETVSYLMTALNRVAELHPNTPKAFVGDLSAPRGGPLSPHVSHQSGRDVDLGFFVLGAHQSWYQRATPKNLDLPRTWTLIRTLVTDTDIEMILIDQSLFAPLIDYAISVGEDPTWVRSLFAIQGSRRPLVRHAPGHATHLHLRFYNPVAQESARRLAPILIEKGKLAPLVTVRNHLAKRGESLARLAARYGVPMGEIRRINGMRGTTLFAGRTYRIPVRGGVQVSVPRVTIPARRLPPRPAREP